MTSERFITLKPVEILLVDDNPADVDLTREAFKDARVVNRLHVVNDGDEALQFLRREGRFAQAPRPDMMILDLNMPRKDGHEVLAEMSKDENLAAIPVVVLTTSREDQDIIDSFYRGAKCYVTKPIDLNMFFVTLRNLGDFGWAIVKPPATKEG